MSDKCKMSSKTASTSAPTTAADEEADPDDAMITSRSSKLSAVPRNPEDLGS